jgi:uncharacterized protein (DUF433 family)
MPAMTDPVSVPIQQDPPGVFRVGESRVLLELVLRAYKDGNSPEQIVTLYDTLDLGDVYAVITAYLARPALFDAYLQTQEQLAKEIRGVIEVAQGGPQGDLRSVLLARRKAKEDGNAQAGQ